MSLSQFHYVLLHRVGLHLFPFFDLSFYFSIKFKCPKNDNNFWGSIITPVPIYVSIIRLYIFYTLYCIVQIKSESQAEGESMVRWGRKNYRTCPFPTRTRHCFPLALLTIFFCALLSSFSYQSCWSSLLLIKDQKMAFPWSLSLR